MSTKRFRSRNNLSCIYGRNTVSNAAPGCSSGTVQGSLVPLAKIGEVWTMSDYVTKGFDAKSGAGVIINNPLETTYEKHVASGNHWKIHSNYKACTNPVLYEVHDYSGPYALNYFRGAYFPAGGAAPLALGVLSASDISNAKSVAATAAWSQVRQSQADVLTDIAEIRQTLDLIRNPLQRGHRFVDDIIHKRGKSLALGSRDAVDYANSMWLQYRYGIRPMVKSISGVIASLDGNRDPHRYTARGSYNLFGSSTVTSRVWPSSAYGFDCRNTYMDVLDVRAGILMEDVVSLRAALGIDAAGMLSLPWELVPYSFVADWFLNVGTFLKALTPYLTKRPLSTWTTVKRTQTVTFQVLNGVSAPVNSWIEDRASNELRVSTYESVTRTPFIYSPSVVVKPQSFEAVVTDLRLLDSFSLLTQKMNRVFKR